MSDTSRTMSSADHADAWRRHNDDAVYHIDRAQSCPPEDVDRHTALAQAHATLSHTHAYLMVEGLRS